MEYDCGDSFVFDSEPNGFPFGSQSKGIQSLRLYYYKFEKNRKIYFSEFTVA